MLSSLMVEDCLNVHLYKQQFKTLNNLKIKYYIQKIKKNVLKWKILNTLFTIAQTTKTTGKETTPK